LKPTSDNSSTHQSGDVIEGSSGRAQLGNPQYTNMLIKGYNKSELLSKIYDIEGFDYFFNDHINLDDITDKRFRKLVEAYQKASSALHEFLDNADED